MTGFDQDMLKFAVQWAPYGGGEEHILPTFGLFPADYYERLKSLLDSTAARSVDSASRRHLREHCSIRLAQTRGTRFRSLSAGHPEPQP
ncbi:DUF3263 domain-containing protein [Rhodococcus sp. USK10]|nr:DUF3263 domain-containing protein [Rhodococcus sp. USK10]